MDSRLASVEVKVEELKESAPSANGQGVVLQTEALVDGERRDTAIEVHDDDASAVAVALLHTEALDHRAAPADGLAPAMRCLAAGLVDGADPSLVRLHLQFDSGQVLPVEMSHDAAVALCRGLMAETGLDLAASRGLRPKG